MADVDFDDYGAFVPYDQGETQRNGLRVQRMINGAGALTSVLLVVGLGVWGYKLAVRDVMGVPVIRALEGPARIAPADPGGELALHQGLAVNAIAAEGEAAAPAERLVLAPRQVDLAPTDQPIANVVPATVPQIGVDPLDPMMLASAPAAAPIADGANATPLVILPADVPGVAMSPRPLSRPINLAEDGSVTNEDAMAEAALAAVAAALAPEDAPAADATTTATATPAATAAEIDPATLPAGTRLAQLGAFASADEARAEWARVTTDLAPLMTGKQRVIETAQSGGKTFYRLRVEGFADLADTRRFCEALKAEGRLCTPAQAQG